VTGSAAEGGRTRVSGTIGRGNQQEGAGCVQLSAFRSLSESTVAPKGCGSKICQAWVPKAL